MSDKPSLLIATPMYGGLCTMQYLESMLATYEWLGQEGIPFYTYFMGNESLITRGRNACATLAIEKKFDKLLFIDADIGWKPIDVAQLYYSDKKIIGGLYPHKTLPIVLNGNTFEGAKPDEFNDLPVEHIATGFLMINLEVLTEMSKEAARYESAHMNGKVQRYYDLFRCGALPSGLYESEDWYFCRKARELGFEIFAQQDTILTHTGSYTFRYER